MCHAPEAHFQRDNAPMPPLSHTSTTSTAHGPGSATVVHGNALDLYPVWPSPAAIISDGPYGVAGYPGDPASHQGLGAWYAPHIAEWARLSTPETTLWFWNTEVGWATVHPTLELNGWEYKGLHIWDKGISHVAGNVNSRTIRGFPVSTEVCARYTRRADFRDESGDPMSMQRWLRAEWQRAGLSLNRANEACGVKSAASRKYLTQDHLWYFPPVEAMIQLAEYAAEHGTPTDQPYFSLDGVTPLTGDAWSRMRSKWTHTHGTTNVWREGTVRGPERLKASGTKALHTNQKPLALMDLNVLSVTDPGDVVWEPFGGLCTAAIAAARNGRRGFAAELTADVYEQAAGRVADELS